MSCAISTFRSSACTCPIYNCSRENVSFADLRFSSSANLELTRSVPSMIVVPRHLISKALSITSKPPYETNLIHFRFGTRSSPALCLESIVVIPQAKFSNASRATFAPKTIDRILARAMLIGSGTNPQSGAA